MGSNRKVEELLYERPVLVTGADGFVGSHLAEKLLEFGAIVHIFVRATSSGMLNNLGQIKDKIIISRGDLADKQAVSLALKELKKYRKKPIIFHLGAQAHVGESWARPYETFSTNALGTLNILQSIVDLGLDIFKLDTAGSSEEFGNLEKDMINSYRFGKSGEIIFDEKSPINPQSVYATSKVAADFLTRAFYKAYKLPGIVTRMFNNYGPRQSPRFITGTIITQAICKDTIELGYIYSKRDFCFVKDGIRGHIYATLFGNPGEVYVFGHGENISIYDWYNLIIDLGKEMGYWRDKKLLSNVKTRGRLGKSEVEELKVNYSKLNKLTGWKPKYTWEEGLRETIKWYVGNKEKWINRVDW